MVALRNSRDYDPADVKRFIAEGYWNDDTIATWLDKWGQLTPDKIAILGPAGGITYAELHNRARRVAGAMLDLGIGKGEAVAIQLPNMPEYLIAYFGVAMMGGVLLTMHMPYRGGEMEPLLEHGQARAVICGAATEKYDAPATMEGLKGSVPSLEHVIVATGAAGEVGPGRLSLAEMIDNGPERDITDPPVASDPVLLCFTSGTSAEPKAVLRNHYTACANGRIYSPTIGLTAQDVVMVAPPFTHVFGLSCVHAALWAGATNTLMELFTPEAYAETIERAKPTVLFTAPTHIAATLKAGFFESHDISSLKTVVVAGSVCPPEVAAALEERMSDGGRVGQLFGMTETILIMQTPPDGPPATRHAHTGQVTEGIEARIVADDGTIQPPGAEGELQVRGYTIMSGYLNNAAANEATFTEDNWMRSGDLAVMDADGNVAITGRVKDIINRGGIKINPTDLESLITAHRKVVLSAIAPMPDDVLGEKACLFVTLVPGAELTLDEVTAYLGDNDVAKMKWPERLVILDEMPMTPTRKIIKGELMRLAG